MLKDHPKDPYCRYYRIGGVTIQLEADLPLTAETFHPKFKAFEVDGPDEEAITIRHHFHLPPLSDLDLGEEVYLKPPWAIYRKKGGWSYVQISPYRCTSISRLWNRFRCGLPALPGASHEKDGQPGSRTSCLERRWYVHLLAEFDQDHTSGHIYSRSKGFFRKGNHHSLTLFPTDQILLAHVLADRQGCYLHSSGAVLDVAVDAVVVTPLGKFHVKCGQKGFSAFPERGPVRCDPFQIASHFLVLRSSLQEPQMSSRSSTTRALLSNSRG